MDAMAEIRQTFFQECEEQLIELESGLLSIQGGVDDPEVVNAVFRAVHSIKGGAGAFDLADLVHFAHVFENTLDLMRTGRIGPEPSLVKIMLRAVDHLADLVMAARDGGEPDESRGDELVGELSGFISDVGTSGSAAPEPEFVFEPVKFDFGAFDDMGSAAPSVPRYRISFKPTADLYAKGNETAILFRELGKLGTMSVECDASALPNLDTIDPEGAYLSWSIDLETASGEPAIREIFDFVEWDSEFSVETIADDAGLPPLDYGVDDATVVDVDLDASAFVPNGDALAEIDVAEAHVAKPDHAKPDLGKSDVPKPDVAKLDAPEPAAAPVKSGAAKSGATRSESAGPKADAGKAETAKGAAATIRVDLDRVDRLIDLVGELVINQAMLTERVAELALPRMSSVGVGLDELEQLTRQIQDSVMTIRAQPVRSVFQRLPRLVREVAAQTGKSVRLVMEGEGTEVDKTVIERLIDPLTHMVRNAIDHGLERAEVRRAKGKSEDGVLKIAALHRSGRIVLEISDDGAGINRERVRQIAIDKNLISPDVRLTDEEIDDLIFLPGFSTAEKLSDISGRGVGMDVVRSSVAALGGRISITSRPGQGSTFTMSLPLTLAVLDGMIVTVANETIVIPLSAIVEILMPQAIDVHAFGVNSRVIGLRNTFIPLVDLGRRLGFRQGGTDPRSGITLLVEAESGVRKALIVDAIQGQRQVVIKSLESNYGTVPGISAATILGDGRVALILDVDAMLVEPRVERFATDPAQSRAG